MNSNTPEPDNAKYDAFFEDIEHVLERQVQQKSRGLNDYNIFTSLLKVHDEVRLHSRFLHSLLNPDGAHYQGTLFLKLFLDVIGLSDFGLDPHQASVLVEHDNIDLYITDGERHVIIENKIWAEDQPDQIIRYIHSVAQDVNDLVTDTVNGIAQIDGDSVRVVYLTARNEKYEPTGHIVEGGYIMANPKTLRDGVINYRARFHRITYEDDIMRWLQAAQHEVSNLSNLNLVIDQYREVVQRLYRKYKGKVMTFENYLFDSGDDKIGTIRLALSLEKELANIKGRTLYEFFKRLGEFEIAGKKGELYSVDKKKEFGDALCKQWVRRKKNGPRDFGVKWNLGGDMFVAVHAGISHLHVGINCKLGGDCTDRKLFGKPLEDRNWSPPFSSYDLGKYEGIDMEICLGRRDKDIVSALEALSQGIKLS